MPFWKTSGYSRNGAWHEGITPPCCTEKQEFPHPFNKYKEGSGSQTILPLPEQLKGAILPITSFLNDHNTP